jgi:hypothetical protein
MSDYLGHLAARSVASAETPAAVQPRLASRFEPVPSGLPSFQAEPRPAAFHETAVEERAPEPPQASVISPSPREWRGGQGVRPRRAGRSEEQDAPRATLAESPEPAPALVVPLQGPVADRGVLPSEASPVGEEAEQRQQGQQRRQGPRGSEKSGLGVLLAVPVVAAVPAVPVRLTPPDRPSQAEAAKTAPPEDRQPSKRDPASTVLQPKITVVEPAPSPARREAPAPTIQVTIGRIEVRATPAAKAPVRERPAAPSSLSLEEYLRQRSKGGRG